jgi:Flp pilus assembly protein TadG
MMSLFNRRRPKGLLRPLGPEAGSSTMEVVLLSPVLFLILFATLDLGRWAFLAIEVSSAARAGAQYGGQNRGTALDTSGIQTAAQNDVLPDIRSSLTVTPSTLCWCSNNPGSAVACNLSSCTAGNTTNNLIPLLKVNTSYTYTPWMLYGPFTTSVTITGQAVVPQGQ